MRILKLPQTLLLYSLLMTSIAMNQPFFTSFILKDWHTIEFVPARRTALEQSISELSQIFNWWIETMILFNASKKTNFIYLSSRQFHIRQHHCRKCEAQICSGPRYFWCFIFSLSFFGRVTLLLSKQVSDRLGVLTSKSTSGFLHTSPYPCSLYIIRMSFTRAWRISRTYTVVKLKQLLKMV